MRRFTVISEDKQLMYVRKPRSEFKDGDVVRVTYQDGHSVLLTIHQAKYSSACSKCCLDGRGHKCLSYKEGDIDCCLAGAYKYFKSFDDIMENI